MSWRGRVDHDRTLDSFAGLQGVQAGHLLSPSHSDDEEGEVKESGGGMRMPLSKCRSSTIAYHALMYSFEGYA